MNNPWLEISHSDYENHMTEVGQMQVLNNLTKYSLEKYQPINFALLGCSTGNGLEHINAEITQNVYAIDINSEYLKETKNEFDSKISNLVTINADIQHNELPIKHIDLFFVGLVLEYVNPEVALRKIIKTLHENGILMIVIQKTKKTSFVSKTKFKSLEKLATISNEVNEEIMNQFIKSQNLAFIKKDEIELTENKSFITLEYKLKSK